MTRQRRSFSTEFKFETASLVLDQGYSVGRPKVRRLMKEAGLVCKQPGSRAYKVATVERPDIPKTLLSSSRLPHLPRRT